MQYELCSSIRTFSLNIFDTKLLFQLTDHSTNITGPFHQTCWFVYLYSKQLREFEDNRIVDS